MVYLTKRLNAMANKVIEYDFNRISILLYKLLAFLM